MILKQLGASGQKLVCCRRYEYVSSRVVRLSVVRIDFCGEGGAGESLQLFERFIYNDEIKRLEQQQRFTNYFLPRVMWRDGANT